MVPRFKPRASGKENRRILLAAMGRRSLKERSFGRQSFRPCATRRCSLPRVWVGCPDVFVGHFRDSLPKAPGRFQDVFAGVDAAFAQAPSSEDLLWLRDNAQQLSSDARAVANELGPLTRLPHVGNEGRILPRVLAIAQAFFDETEATSFARTSSQNFVWALRRPRLSSFMNWRPRTGAEAGFAGKDCGPGRPSRGRSGEQIQQACYDANPHLRNVNQTSWKDVLEHLIPFDRILREDPAGSYAAMDIESRNVYREKVANIAQRSDRTELEVAKEALALARQAQQKKFSDAAD